MTNSALAEKQIEAVEEFIHQQDYNVVTTSDFIDPDQLYAQLINKIHEYHPSTDIAMIEKAYHLARDAHKGQVRKSGEEYIIHPLCVAIILADLELDKETIVAGLLHDVAEDTVMTIDEIAEEFSPEVALLVDGVTKLGQLSYNVDKVDVQAENLRKMFLAMAKDIRVILIKLADRLHNMRTLKYMTPEKQKEKARETMEIYAPLASRLGISRVKVELDDISLKYLDPEAYYGLVEQISLRKAERDAYVRTLEEQITKQIQDAGIKAEIMGRAKHFFSIYKKMVTQNKTIDQIYDLFAIRIIVDSIKDCYAALGVMHELYTPIPGRFKDYIAMPKPNMYQSLHTTLIGPDGSPFEVQIRTWDMHRTSEYGIAAHWKYKESGEGATVNQEEAKLSWLREILEWQQDASDNKEFVSLLKSDLNLFSETVFCFTPTGEVKNLPQGSIPIDFAYAIHSAVGNRMVGAKVNGRLVPIDYTIKNGDRIEIITSQNSRGPGRDWLSMVKSTQAKNKINQWFRSRDKDDNIARGKNLLAEAAKAKGIDIAIVTNPDYQKRVMTKYGLKDWETLLATVGHGGIKETQVVSRMNDMYQKDHPALVTDEDILSETEARKDKVAAGYNTKHSSGITVRGLSDVSVRFSKCCSPVPGDEIVGFITRGRGISIHRTDCSNMINLPDIEKARLIEAEWEAGSFEEHEDVLYDTEINIYANNRKGLLVDVSRIFTEAEIDITAIHTTTSKQGIATMTVKFGTKGKEELRNLTEKLRQIPGVMDIERTAG